MDTPSNETNRTILIFVYGSWGSECYASATNMEDAHKKALAASVKDPKNEYCIELEPGGFGNPLYKGGVKVQG